MNAWAETTQLVTQSRLCRTNQISGVGGDVLHQDGQGQLEDPEETGDSHMPQAWLAGIKSGLPVSRLEGSPKNFAEHGIIADRRWQSCRGGAIASSIRAAEWQRLSILLDDALCFPLLAQSLLLLPFRLGGLLLGSPRGQGWRSPSTAGQLGEDRS